MPTEEPKDPAILFAAALHGMNVERYREWLKEVQRGCDAIGLGEFVTDLDDLCSEEDS